MLISVFKANKAARVGVCSVQTRNFAKKKKAKTIGREVKGLRKSQFTPSHEMQNLKDEIYLGPTWIICPKDVNDPENIEDSSHNWIKRELKHVLVKRFPQHETLAHRGKQYCNKFHFKHPDLHTMTSERIRNYLLQEQIQRVLLFSDGWEDTQYNPEYGYIYLSDKGDIVNREHVGDKLLPPILPNHTLVTSPMVYFIRDLVAECSEMGDIPVYVFQNIKGYSKVLQKSKHDNSYEIDYDQAKNKLVSLSFSDKNSDEELKNKLAVSILMKSLINVKSVHSVFTPLVLSYTHPGRISSEWMLYYYAKRALKVIDEEAKVPNLSSNFAMLTSNHLSKCICEIIKKNMFLNPDPTPFPRKEIYISGYSVSMFDYAAGLSSVISPFRYTMSDTVIRDFPKESVENLLKWPEEFHHEGSDILLQNEVTEHIGSIKYRTAFRQMLVNFYDQNLFPHK